MQFVETIQSGDDRSEPLKPRMAALGQYNALLIRLFAWHRDILSVGEELS